MVIHTCAIYGTPISNKEQLWKTCKKKKTIKTLRSKVNVVSGSRMCATQPLMVIHPCAKYDKPCNVKPKKKLWAGHEYAQTDGQTDVWIDRRTDRVTLSLFTGGNYIKIFSMFSPIIVLTSTVTWGFCLF